MLFKNFCVTFLLPKNFIILHAVSGGHFCIALNLLKYVPFYSHCMHILAIMLRFDLELAKSTGINLKDVFVFHPVFHFRLVMK